jgi:hypothetical protein
MKKLEYPITSSSLEEWKKECKYQQALWKARKTKATMIESFIDHAPNAVFIDGFENAILGLTADGRVIYDSSVIIDLLMEDKGLNLLDALEVFDKDFIEVYVGNKDPIFQKTEF